MKQRTPALVVLAVFVVALAARTAPLYWSPLPSTLDGFGYAAQARDTIALGHFPLADFRADNLVFAGLLATAGVVVDVRPLHLAQPVVAVVGAASCLAGVAVITRAGRSLHWSGERVRSAALFAGVGLAASGIYLRRTSVPDEEALAYLLLPLLAIAVHRFLRTERRAWGLIAVLLLVAFPLVHTFSTLIAALTLTALLVAHLHASLSLRSGLLGAALVGGFWAYFVTYYELAGRTVLTVPYVGRVSAHPGSFVAWVVVLVLGVVWFRSASHRSRRVAVLLPIAGWFVVLVANRFVPVFPGTVPTHPLLVGAVLLYLLPLVAASRAASVMADDRAGSVVLALLAAPVVHVGFSLTADLTPEFFDTVVRTQTFAHFPVFLLAAATVGWLVAPPDRDVSSFLRARSVRLGVVALLLASVVLTAPLAFVTLDTMAVPSTTTQAEFAGATFAATHLDGPWATDHKRSRVAVHYYDASPAIAPVANWLRGGPPPGCPVLSTSAWTTTGAHFFPAAPETIEPDRYDAWLQESDLVYATAGAREVVLARPGAGGDC